jgi:CCR4-NOT transcription complex subunit 1
LIALDDDWPNPEPLLNLSTPLSPRFRTSATGRYLLLVAAIQQLRWTNSHTLWYSSLLIDTFRSTESEVVKEQVARVFLERLLVQRPHPFGMIYAFIKFLSQCGSASQLNHHHHQHQHQNENGNPSLDADDRELRSISSLESLKVVKKSQELKALFSICRKHVVQIN